MLCLAVNMYYFVLPEHPFITYSIFLFVLTYFIHVFFKRASEIPSFDDDKRC